MKIIYVERITTMETINGRIVIVGASGYWGSILTRVAIETFGSSHVATYDIDDNRLTSLATNLKTQGVIPSTSLLNVGTDLDTLLEGDDNNYFVIATPPHLHHQIGMKVLRAKKNVLITKPIAMSAREAEEIQALATEQGVVVMADHTFLFHPGVSAMIAEVKTGAIGTPKTFYANWLSRGKIQDAADVIWDLAPHPLSILLEFWDGPIDISCKVLDSLDGVPTEASLYLHEKRTDNSAIIHVSWMDADKSRTFKIRGSHHTIIFDDTRDIDSKLRIKGGQILGHPLLGEGYKGPIRQLAYSKERQIELSWEEPLRKELCSFVDLSMMAPVVDGKPQTDQIEKAIACIKLIEAAQQSIRQAQGNAY